MYYAHQVLGVNESIIAEAKVSIFAFFGDLFSIFILTILFFITYSDYYTKQIALIIFISILAIVFRIIIIYMSTELVLTNRKVIAKFGIIRRRVLELRLEKIESFAVDQGILGRLLNYGTIAMYGANTCAPLHKIHAPIEFKKLVDEHIENKLAK